MKFKKLHIAVAVSAALGAGVVGQAGAAPNQAVAQSLLNTTNFVFSNQPAGTLLSLADFTTFTFNDLLTNTTTLNGNLAGTSKSVSGPPFVASVDAPRSCQGPGCPGYAENNFTIASRLATVPPTSTFVQSDGLTFGEPLQGTGFATGSTQNNAADVNLNTPGQTGGATSDLLGTTTLSFTLAHAIASIGIDFDVEELLRSWTGTGTTLGTSAGAQFTWEFKITGPGGVTLVDWTPDGNISTGTQVGLTVTQEACNMNKSTGASFNDPQAAFTCAGHNKAVSSVAFLADTQYTATLTQHTIANAVTAQVPEPATLGLLGAGLAGLGFARRRRTTV